MKENELTPAGKIITGYKATDENMCCRGFQFELGKWYEHDGELSLCNSGFHFCEYQSGPLCYYIEKGTRLFKCEAEFVLLSKCPGADLKHVAKKIRLLDEIKLTGDRNTGDMNAGDRNTGDWNTGDRNTGDMNAGNMNTGNMNTGNRNTGNRNTGTGNTGNGNTGNGNTGNGNTGNMNTGNMNTGDGNAGNYNSGFFNIKDAPFIVFGVKADRKVFDYNLANELAEKLSYDDEFDTTPYLSIPGATKKKIKRLHAEHIRLRKRKK